jgi:hypothetical protein
MLKPLLKNLGEKMAKDLFELKWIEKLLPEGFLRKHMFGGFGYYVDDRIVLALFENPGDYTFNNHKFDFEVWNGCLFPTEREHHEEIKKHFPILIPHPVLSKWVYLPSQTEDFDSIVEEVLREIRRRSSLFGVTPKAKKKSTVKSITTKSKSISKGRSEQIKTIDTRRPQMFREETMEVKLLKAKKISDLKNLGPTTEKAFLKVGIKSVNQFVKLGWKKTLQKLIKSNPKYLHTLYAYALIGALNNTEWNRLLEQDKIEAKKFTNSLKPKKSNHLLG